MAEDILLEGGAAGHMNHLYDDPDLTFSKLQEIFDAAASGKLEGTEKTDGQNLMVSFSVDEGRAKGARNKTDIIQGGLSPEQLANKFAGHANQELKNSFSDALKAFEKTVQGLSHPQQITLFGQNANIFYNAEVLDPRVPNVINYDTKTLVIHRSGHVEIDRETGEKTDRDLSQEALALEKHIIESQKQKEQDKFSVQTGAIKKLKALEDKRPLNTAIGKIKSLLTNVNSLIKNDSLKLNMNSSVGDFMAARVYILINSILKNGNVKNVDPVAKMNIGKRILGVKGISVKDIAANVTKDQLLFVKENLLNDQSRKEILKTAIMPLEHIVNDFAIEMLKDMQSAFILDNKKETERLKGELQAAISAIESSGNEEAMSILKKQMAKLKKIENLSTPAEGFVFDYAGTTYKFTGGFAPMNQILGLFKYGRGSIPPMRMNEAKQPAKETIALIPGAFKPPHKGHMAMVKAYAKMADKVIILVSPLPRETPNGRPITLEMSKKIWDIYLEADGLKEKVFFLDSPWSSPVKSAMTFISNEDNRPEYAQPGQKILLGVSTKGEDATRFDGSESKYAKEGVEVVAKPVPSMGKISATDFRKAIAAGNKDQIKKYLPDSVNKTKAANDILSIVNGTVQPQKVDESVIYDIIIEQLKKNGNKYCLLVKQQKKIEKENTTVSSVQGAIKPLEKTEQ